VYQLLLETIKLFRSFPSLIDVEVPAGSHLTVCGDVHGQYYDLLNIFQLNGWPSEDNPYLFNGDFVDRGSFSMEVILTFLALKLAFPKHFHMLRGNHETTNMNNIYGFRGTTLCT
jgi:serine/threonine-protein phosphatase 5